MASCDIPVTVAPVRPIAVEVETCTGSPGTPGARGSRWFYESSATPTHNDVNDPQIGDAFLYTDGTLWSYGFNGWAQRGNLMGPPGPSGSSDEAIAGWVADDASLTQAALDNWIGYRFTYVDEALGDGVTDATAGIQASLDAVHDEGGGTVVIPPGNYRTSSPLTLPADSLILGYGATLHRTGTNGMMVINWVPSDSTTTEYNGRGNIVVQGLTIDGHAGDTGWPNEDTPNQPLTFSHCSNITVRDCRFLRSHTNHALELNAVDGALVDNCSFEGWEPGVSTTREAVQIDCAVAGPGAHDDTMARNIVVRDCRIKAYGSLPAHATGVGSHSAPSGGQYVGIRVQGCMIEDVTYAGVRPYHWIHSRVEGNWISAGDTPWAAAGVSHTACFWVTVADNVIQGYTRAADAGVGIEAGNDNSSLVFSGNVIRYANDGIAGAMNYVSVTNNLITDTFRYSISIGGSNNLVSNNMCLRTNGASVIRFYTGSASANSVTGNKYRAVGDPAAAYGVSIASGQTVWAFGNDFLGAAALTSGTIDTTVNRI